MLRTDDAFIGTSARSLLTAFLKAAIFNTEKQTVLVPCFCCEAVYLSAYFAGANVVFVDVDVKTFSLDISDLERKITEDTVCIIVPHMFGYLGYTDKLFQLCQAHPDIIWLDDACQTYLVSPTQNSKDLYNCLDFRLSSFHSSKPLSGNIAMLECFTEMNAKQSIFAYAIENSEYSNDLRKDHEVRRMQASYFSFIVSYDRLGLGFIHADKNIYNSFIDSYRFVIKPSKDCLSEAQESYHLSINDNYIGPHLISAFCDQFPKCTQVSLTKPAVDERLWRLPLVFSESSRQEQVAHTLRSAQVNVSNHYYCLEKLFSQNSSSSPCPSSSALSLRILNLWFRDEDQMLLASSILNDCMLKSSTNTNP